MLLGSGSIRKEKLGPIVTLQDLMETFPYDDSLHMLTITGKQLKEMIKYMLRDEAFEGDHTEFYQFSDGIKIEYNYETKQLEKFTYLGKEIKEDNIYRIGLQKYHYLNAEKGFNITPEELEKETKSKILATSCRDIIEEYLSTHQLLNADIKKNKRLIIKNRP